MAIFGGTFSLQSSVSFSGWSGFQLQELTITLPVELINFQMRLHLLVESKLWMIKEELIYEMRYHVAVYGIYINSLQ